MIKLYKHDNNDFLYAECWVDANQVIIHKGKIGKKGHTEQLNLKDKLNSEEDIINSFKKKFELEGYQKIPHDSVYLLVVQFPMKSIKGNKRDHWLKDKVIEYLDNELGWLGVGHIDGFDMGQQISFPTKYTLNIFCEVVDESIGIAAIKRCLREYRLDYTHIKIASKLYFSDNKFELKYSAKKQDQTFSL